MSEQISTDELIEAAMGDLIELTVTWNAHRHIPSGEQEKCREIGKRLHALGGIRAMRTAFYEVKNINRATSVVAAYWDGIGDWQW